MTMVYDPLTSLMPAGKNWRKRWRKSACRRHLIQLTTDMNY
jgi:hypothetical protein